MNLRNVVSAASLAGLLTLAAAVPAAAMEAMSCTTAHASMMKAMHMPAMTSTGNVDKDFMAMMKAEKKSMMMLSKIEMACGKDPKTKTAAKSTMTELQSLLGGG